jgi:phosphoribosyl-ATP pyrophosphohydrolase/phosphoribosyl-AMP cyclohydrolase
MKVNFDKNGLVPAIVQDEKTKVVLMLGYMNTEAIYLTKKNKKVTFYSRSKKRIWMKGEESGNFLEFISMKSDCDNDTLLVRAIPAGNVCHKGDDTCWGEKNFEQISFVTELEEIISDRFSNRDENSYISTLFNKGINKIAQKFGEEAVELVIESKDDKDELFLNESADVLFHFLILIKSKGFSFTDVIDKLEGRKK